MAQKDKQLNKKRNYLELINEVIKLTENKKVNKENAFDVNIEQISIGNMKEFLQQHDKLESKWMRTGEALGAGAKIYGFRVDNVHNDAYKMMGSLARNQNGDLELEIVQENDQDDEDQNNSQNE